MDSLDLAFGEPALDSLDVEVLDNPVLPDSLCFEEGICDEWHVRDHLGSVRAIVGIGTGIIGIRELNTYLPFGTRISGSIQAADNRHRFGGKEEQRYGSFNLGLSDFGARYYDPVTCRWTTRDPMVGKYPSLSPYNYCAGNPVNLVDLDGMADKKWVLGGLGLVGKGIVETASGFAIASSGVGAGAAAFLLSDGFTSIGLGLGMVTAGAAAENSTRLDYEAYEIMKDGPVGAFTKSLDMATETDVPVFEIAGNMVESAVGISTFKAPQNFIDWLSDGLAVIQTVETVKTIHVQVMSETKNSGTIQSHSQSTYNSIQEWNKKITEKGLWTPLE